MMVDFQLSDWIFYWKFHFGFEAIHTDRETGERIWMPLLDKLEYELEALKSDIRNERDSKRQKRLVQQLHMTIGKGSEQIRGGHLMYYKAVIRRHFGIQSDEWEAMSLRDKGYWIAAMQMENAIQTYQRFLNNAL